MEGLRSHLYNSARQRFRWVSSFVALITASLDVPIRIEYMDQTQAPNGGWHHDFPEDREPQLFFLYRPGHYDILYLKN